jgi:hypothetical protein
MKGITATTLIMLANLGAMTCAQAGDSTEGLKGCARFDGMERLNCIDELLGEAAVPTNPPPSQGQSWIISETTSPVDYKPQIEAQTIGHPTTKDAPSSFSIHCRAGRTELMISTSPSWRPVSGSDVKVEYQVNDQPSVEERWRAAESGKSLAFQGDVVRLLRSMPEGGQLLIRVYAGKALPYESTFRLTGMDAVRGKFAKACNWPNS